MKHYGPSVTDTHFCWVLLRRQTFDSKWANKLQNVAEIQHCSPLMWNMSTDLLGGTNKEVRLPIRYSAVSQSILRPDWWCVGGGSDSSFMTDLWWPAPLLVCGSVLTILQMYFSSFEESLCNKAYTFDHYRSVRKTFQIPAFSASDEAEHWFITKVFLNSSNENSLQVQCFASSNRTQTSQTFPRPRNSISPWPVCKPTDKIFWNYKNLSISALVC